MKNMYFEKDDVKYEIVNFFKNEETNKSYIVYKIKDQDTLYASKYNIVNNNLYLSEIKTDEEWDYIDSMIEAANE